MNLLDALPEVGKILDSLVSTPEEKRDAELKLKEIDVRELEARFGAIKAWQSNSSLFVAGAIPSMLWLVVVVTLFNYIVAPLLSALGLVVPTLELPEAYYTLAGTIVLGLFGKKAWDATEIDGATWTKKAKSYMQQDISDAAQERKSAKPQKRKPVSEMTQAEVDARFADLAAEYGISGGDTSGNE